MSNFRDEANSRTLNFAADFWVQEWWPFECNSKYYCQVTVWCCCCVIVSVPVAVVAFAHLPGMWSHNDANSFQCRALFLWQPVETFPLPSFLSLYLSLEYFSCFSAFFLLVLTYTVTFRACCCCRCALWIPVYVSICLSLSPLCLSVYQSIAFESLRKYLSILFPTVI